MTLAIAVGSLDGEASRLISALRNSARNPDP
jgi:hypothetical protein